MKHRVFKFLSSDKEKVIVWIPTLYKLYSTEISHYEDIPDYVLDEKEAGLRETANQDSKYQFTSATLFLTTQCNLRCSYCYEDAGPLKGGETMPEQTAFAAIDYILSWASKKNRNSRLSFFGGEPTLAWSLLVNCLEYYQTKSAKENCQTGTRITTNGVMKEERASWLAENIDGITISLDGPKDIHNIQRGNFDKVFKTASLIYKTSPQKVSFRVTVTRDSINLLPDISKFFGENFPGVILNFEPVEPSVLKEYSFLFFEHQLFFQKFIESIQIAKSYKLKIRTSVSMINSLHNRFCGIGQSNFMILPDGRVTACNRMTGRDRISGIFEYGYYDKKKNVFVFDDEKYELLQKLTVDNIPKCTNCLARYSCCGDCPATKIVIYKGDADFWRKESPYCKEISDFTKRFLEFLVFNGTEGIVLV